MMKRTSSNAAVLADADDAALAAKFAERSKVDKMQQKAESTMEVDVTVFKCQTVCNAIRKIVRQMTQLWAVLLP